MKSDEPDRVRLINDSVVFSGFNRLRKLRLRYRKHDGAWSNVIERELFERHDAVVVLPYDPVRDQIVFVEQFRLGAFAAGQDSWQLEPIGGLLETGSDVEAALRREAQEEAGCTIGAIEPIGRMLVSPGCCTELVHSFCGQVDASALGGTHGCAQEDEDTLVHVLDFATAERMMAEGAFQYMVTACCMFWLATNRDRLRRLWAA
jgi:ADP-ribose pyrophosphatase